MELEPTVHELRPSKEQLLHAISPVSSVDNPKIACEFCNKLFTNRGSKRFHVLRRHRTESTDVQNDTIDRLLGVEENAGPEKQRQLLFFCPMEQCRVNKTQFKSAKLLIQHFQKTHMEKSHKCCDCTARFALERDLRYHRKKVCPKRAKLDFNAIEVNVASTGNTTKVREQCTQTNSLLEWTHLSGQSLVLVPVKIDKRIIFKRILPKSVGRKTVSTQTDEQQGHRIPSSSYCGMAQLSPFCYNDSSNYFTEETSHHINTQQNLQVDNISAELQSHNAYAQTIYPQTIDFSAQYSGHTDECTASTSSSIYLPPFMASSTQTPPQLYYLSEDLLFPKNDCEGLQSDSDGQYSMLHETQSSSTQTLHHQQMLMDGEDNGYCDWHSPNRLLANMDSLEMFSVAAQTDLSWETMMDC